MTTNGDGREDWEVRRGETGKTELKTRPSGQRRAALGSLRKVVLSFRFTPHREAQGQSSRTPICAADKHGMTDLAA